MTRWEYICIPAHLDSMNAMGQEGWECVGIFNSIAWLKRPIDGRKTVKQTDTWVSSQHGSASR